LDYGDSDYGDRIRIALFLDQQPTTDFLGQTRPVSHQAVDLMEA